MMNKYLWGIVALWLFGAAVVMAYDAAALHSCLQEHSEATCYEAFN